MKIISLKNVSKFYYNKGIIASGFSKINLDFEIGEFVAITGESGSGKSTLLNVISGVDTYEEGEMYINGKETSHYQESEYSNYRKKYISNIYQNFNLVNSYTVYQNIELVLLLNGYKKSEIKEKVLTLIKQVNLTKFKNTKVSKLSGGQKQRVAIARALAKDTPIIIADEPTGSLDSKSAKAIIKLLSEISKDKLVIIVTHNYEQVSDYVTRKIKMHDGKILEDKQIKKITDNKEYTISNSKDITKTNKLRLGIRNTYNIIPKFLLLLAVFLFIVISIMAEYSTFKEQEYIASTEGWNNFFKDTNDHRIIIKKNDKSIITNGDYKKINQLPNINQVVKNDLLLDTAISLTDDYNIWLYGIVDSIDNFHGKPDIGKLPEKDNEVLIIGNSNDYYLSYIKDETLSANLYLENINNGTIDKTTKLKVTGIKYDDEKIYMENKIYLSNEILEKLKFQTNQKYSKLKFLFLDSYSNNFNVLPSDSVKEGEIIINDILNNNCKNNNCINQKLSIEVKNLYYQENIDLKVTKTYNKKNSKKILGIDNIDDESKVYINTNDYNKLFNKGNYQSSIYVKDTLKIDNTIKELNKMGYKTLKIKDTLVKEGASEVSRILKTVVTIALVITLFFISYFVIRIILKSRQVYFSTIRMLGASKKVCRQLLIIELSIIATIAYSIVIVILYLNYINIIDFNFLSIIIKYFKLYDYILLYIIVILMSLLISIKFSKKIFKDSAIKTLREEI